MQENIITINNADLTVKEYNGHSVVTFKDIDIAHERKTGTADRNFRSNKSKFTEGKDYYFLNSRQINEIRGIKNAPRGITVFTQSSYYKIVKSFNDDLSWGIYQNLLDNYFNVKPQPEQTAIVSDELPIELQMIDKLMAYAKESYKKLSDHEGRIKKLEERKPEEIIVEPNPSYYLESTNCALSKNIYTITTIAEAFGMSGRVLNKYLYTQGIICPHNDGWCINKKVGKESYVRLKFVHFTNSEGKRIEKTLTYWTYEGMTFLCEYLKSNGFTQSRSIVKYDRHASRKKKTKKYAKKKSGGAK